MLFMWCYNHFWCHNRFHCDVIMPFHCSVMTFHCCVMSFVYYHCLELVFLGNLNENRSRQKIVPHGWSTTPLSCRGGSLRIWVIQTTVCLFCVWSMSTHACMRYHLSTIMITSWGCHHEYYMSITVRISNGVWLHYMSMSMYMPAIID